MENFISPKDYSELRKWFISPKNEYRPACFWRLSEDLTDENAVSARLGQIKKNGFGGALLSPNDKTLPSAASEEYIPAYRAMLEKFRKAGLSAIWRDDNGDISGRAGGEFAKKYPGHTAKQLVMREYTCTSGEHVSRKLDDTGKTMSVGAYEIETGRFIDLRKYVYDACSFPNGLSAGGKIEWDVPDGNWNLLQFVCKPVPDCEYVNYLSYESSQKFIDLTYKRFTDNFSEFIGETVCMTYYRDIQFLGQNRRMWDEDFNDTFESDYGFDPAPLYPALYLDMGTDTAHYKALMFSCRAKMLAAGFFKAVADFTKAHGLISTGSVAEPKTIQAAWLFGDGMLYQKYAGAAGLELLHSYGYGINALKLASGAADSFDRDIVVCSMYGDYAKLGPSVLSKEAMHALVRGANYLICDVSDYDPELADKHDSKTEPLSLQSYCEFTARAQTMLRFGRHVCDTALLYPINSLSSQANLFDAPAAGFEFPQTPVGADYMNVINSLLNYSARDLTVLHPEALHKRCYVEGDTLNLSNEVNSEHFKLLVMPGMSMISVKSMRMIAKFFDGGGKVISTGTLPSRAIEFSPEQTTEQISSLTAAPVSENDTEINSLVRHIFGVTMEEVNTFTDYYENKNEAGGRAFFILPSLTGADGTDTVDCARLDSIIGSLGIPFDVEFTGIPRVSDNGIFGLHLPAFCAMNLPKKGLRSGGVFNYIHKKNAGCEIVYAANTTSHDYSGDVCFRGKFSAEEWDPHTGKIKRMPVEIVSKCGTEYTAAQAVIPAGTSIFYVLRETSKNVLEQILKL